MSHVREFPPSGKRRQSDLRYFWHTSCERGWAGVACAIFIAEIKGSPPSHRLPSTVQRWWDKKAISSSTIDYVRRLMTQGLDYFYGMMCFLIISSRPVLLRPGFRHFRPRFDRFPVVALSFSLAFSWFTQLHICKGTLTLSNAILQFLYHFCSAVPIPPYFIYEHYMATIWIVVWNIQLALNAISTLINCTKVKITTNHRWLLFHRNTKGRI